MTQVLVKGVLIGATGFLAVFGGIWVPRPILSPPSGIHSAGWTFAQLIRDRYPVRLIDPGWLSNDMYWIFAETGARLVLLLSLVGALLALTRVVFRSPNT